MNAIDFSRSRAILIGTAHYTRGLTEMPAARNSLHAMRDLLTGPLCGWPKHRVTVLRDRKSRDGIGQDIAAIIHDSTDVLLFYYVGHGQLLDGEHLGMAMVDTHTDPSMRNATSYRLNDLQEELKHRCRARVKLVILDCCFSGLATKNTQGTGLADQVRIVTKVEGAYTLTASRASQQAIYEDGPAGLTYFTKAFTEVVRDGVPGAGASLTLKDIHRKVAARFLCLDLPDGQLRPEPSVLVVDTAEELVFARNAAPTVSGEESPTTRPDPPTPQPDGADSPQADERSARGLRPWARRGGPVALIVMAALVGITTWSQWPSPSPLPAFTDVEIIARQTTADSLEFSPDGRTLAAVDEGRESNTVLLMNTASRQPIGQPFTISYHTGYMEALRFCPDGPTAVTDDSGSQSVVRLWNALSHQEIRQPIIVPDKSVVGALSPDCRTLATVSFGQPNAEETFDTVDTVRLWDVTSGKQIGQPLGVPASGDLTVMFTPDSHTVAIGHDFSNQPSNGLTAPASEVDLWNVASGHPTGRFSYFSTTMGLRAIAFSPDSHTLAQAVSGGGASAVVLWDLTSGQQLGQPIADPDNPSAATFIGSGSVLATENKFSQNGIAHDVVRLWNVASRRQISQPLTGDITAAAFSPDGHTLATANTDNTLRLWRLPPER